MPRIQVELGELFMTHKGTSTEAGDKGKLKERFLNSIALK